MNQEQTPRVYNARFRRLEAALSEEAMPSSEDEETASKLLEAVDELSPVGTQPARPTAAMVTSTI